MPPALHSEISNRPDGELLQRYLDTRDDGALTELVTRHAAVVRGVCHRILGNTPDADDAFQATFLVLVRSTGIRRPQSLASWLYGVALRIARRQRRQQVRPVQVLTENSAMVTADPLTELATRHDVALFDAELARLPEKYRSPIVLHHLEGKSQREVAAELQLTEGAVDGLLKRGRNELRLRLARQGVAFAGTLAALQAAQTATAATISPPLIANTVQAALSLDPSLNPNFPHTPASRLAHQELSAMTFLQITKITAWTLVGSLLLGAAGVGVSTARNLPAAHQAGVIASELAVAQVEDEPTTEVAAEPAESKPENDNVLDGAIIFDDEKKNTSNPNSKERTRIDSKAVADEAVAEDVTNKPSSKGVIRRVAQDMKIVWLNLGSDDGLQPRTTFHIYGPEVDGVRQPKGMIEVTRVLDKHMSEARIVDENLLKPIKPGDQAETNAAQPLAELREAKLSDHPIQKKLDEITELKLGDATLNEAMEAVAQRHGFNIFVDDIAIQKEKKSADLQVSLELSGVTLRTAMKLILEPHGLDYIIDDEMMKIVTKQAAEDHHEIRIYRDHPWHGQMNSQLQSVIQDAVGGLWKPPGSIGPGGTIQVTPAGVAVKHNQRTLLAVEKLLAQLAKSSADGSSDSGPRIGANANPEMIAAQNHRGEKIAIVGEIDLDGDGESDREMFHKLLKDAGIEVTNEVNDAGERTGETIDAGTKFLVIGPMPDPRIRRNRTAAEQAKRVVSHVTELRREARQSGIRVVTLNDYLAYIGQPKANPVPDSEEPRPNHFRKLSPPEARIAAAMQEATEFGFVETSLRDALDYIEELHNFAILINEQEITADGGSADVRITLELSSVTLESGLTLMLKPHDLDYIIKDEVLQITSSNSAAEYHELRVYDLDQFGRMFDGIEFGEVAATQRIITDVQKAVGGLWATKEPFSGGTMSVTPAGLIVRHNQRTHREIENLLEQLRRAGEEK